MSETMIEKASEGGRARSGEELASELAYVRTLAEEGRNAPLIGGRMYLIWGGLIGAVALASYLNNMGVAGFGFAQGFAPWLTVGVLGWGLSFALGKHARAKPGAMTIGNQTAASVWCAVGIFITLFWGSLFIVHDNFTNIGVPRYFLFTLMFPIAFALYGVAFFATATAARLSWLRYFSFLSWGFSITALFLLDSPHHLLVGAVGSFTCAALPGVLLMRREPSDIV